jgi:hypothetical protein
MAVRIAAHAGYHVDELDRLRAPPEKLPLDYRLQLILERPGAQSLGDVIVSAVHHRGGAFQELDLFVALDYPRVYHGALPVDDLYALRFEGPEKGDIDQVHAQLFLVGPMLLQVADDFAGLLFHHADFDGYGAPHRTYRRHYMVRRQPVDALPL